MDGTAILLIASGLLMLVLSSAMAAILVRPPQSPWARRWLALPWSDKNLPDRQRRWKQVLYVVGWFIYGVAWLQDGVLRASGYHNHFLDWLRIAMVAAGLVCLIASFVIADRTQ